jgi:DNA-binding beta-propeller fold protein YncE
MRNRVGATPGRGWSLERVPSLNQYDAMLTSLRRLIFASAAVAAALQVNAAAAVAASFVTFESGPVRPLALSADGSRLFAVNTPDGRLEVFSTEQGALSRLDSVTVGLEPVAVAVRSAGEVWVVNHLSDSVSIVDVAATPARVVRTLLVGDEPRDLVFAGPRNESGAFTRAFITTARRGPHLPASVKAELTVPGTPRALVWVFAADNLGSTVGGTPETIVELFGDTPRALAATPDGSKVYAAIFHSGNQTTAVSEGAVCDGGSNAGICPIDGIQVANGLPNGRAPGGLPAPNLNVQGLRGPETGLIVKLNASSGLWEDQLGRNWTNAVRFNLPDRDVFTIDATADPPVEVAAFAHVGSVLFNLVVHPTSGALYVSNTEARNEVRFEGPGTSASTVRGHLHEARVTVIRGDEVIPRHLNKHLLDLPQGYRTTPMPTEIKDNSLATPLDMVVASDGTLYVAAFGSSKVGVFASTEIDDGTFVPHSAEHIEVTGGGPCGLALDEENRRLYVLTRLDNSIKVVDTDSRAEIAVHRLHNPEPAQVVEGRRFLYDARLTSSNGEASCAACHVFADFDSLGWDLGNPDDVVADSPNPGGPIGGGADFHPLKGPMTTQTLRGMVHHGPMHWRGDRTGGRFPDDPSSLDAHLAFERFNVAFEGLLGRDEGELPAADMSSFADFILEVAMPPNPVRSLDNQLTVREAAGRDIYLNRPATDGIASCNGCHTLDASQGFFGSGGLTTFENEPQEFKVAQLRNAYQKVGMFGMPDISFVEIPLANRQHQGDQVRGFGFLHDGSIATILDFLHATVFFLSDRDREDLEQFVLAFDTDYAPIVGQQVTLSASGGTPAAPRVDLLIARAATAFTLAGSPDAKECDLVVKGVVSGEARGYLFDAAAGNFRSDRITDAPLGDAALRALASVAGQQLTYTCMPPGSGLRAGLDRDEDGYLDRDEIDAGTDPADPTDPGDPPECAGDCDGDATVTVDEIITGVAIALGELAIDVCLSFDASSDGQVSVDEIVMALNAALGGCGAAATATPNGLPDLLFSYFAEPRVNYSCADDLEGEPRLSLCVANHGQVSAGPFEIAVATGVRWEVDSLDLGAEICFSAPLQTTASVQIDPLDVVPEGNESNNTRLVLYPTITRGPACTPTPTP